MTQSVLIVSSSHFTSVHCVSKYSSRHHRSWVHGRGVEGEGLSIPVDVAEVGPGDVEGEGLGVPVDVAEVGPGDGLDREAALQHPALHLLDPVLRLLDISHLDIKTM